MYPREVEVHILSITSCLELFRHMSNTAIVGAVEEHGWTGDFDSDIIFDS
jgi:hypothetical protein